MPLIVDGEINQAWAEAAAGLQWWGFTPYEEGVLPSSYIVDKKAGSSRTWEILATLEHELRTNLSVGLNFMWRKYDHFSWDPMYYYNGPLGDYSIDGRNVILDYKLYSVAGQIPTSIPGVDLGAGAGKDYYLRGYWIEPDETIGMYGWSPYYYHTLNSNYGIYWGIDLMFNKRLSDKWMLDGSISYMDQRYHYGDGYQNPTSLWAINKQIYAPYIGGASGKIDQYIFSHWTFKLEGLYQLPYGFNISFTFNARQGHPIRHYMTIVNYGWANYYENSVELYLDVFGKDKLPIFYQLNLRLEKELKIGDIGRVWIMADGFNVFNKAIINRRYARNEGTLYIYSDGSTSFRPYANNYRINEYLNPFIMRLGVRFQF